MARLRDGFKTTITFSGNGNLFGVKLFEKKVTPPGIKGGGEVSTTGMRNTAWRTKDPKKLADLSELSLSCAYDPYAYQSIITYMTSGEKNCTITVTFPDNHTLTFWGFIDEFTPQELSEGEEPLADVKIIPTNHNNADPWAEIAPVYA